MSKHIKVIALVLGCVFGYAYMMGMTWQIHRELYPQCDQECAADARQASCAGARQAAGVFWPVGIPALFAVWVSRL